MMENVFFQDGDSHVSTGSGCGSGFVSPECQTGTEGVGASHLSPRGQRADELVSPSFA